MRVSLKSYRITLKNENESTAEQSLAPRILMRMHHKGLVHPNTETLRKNLRAASGFQKRICSFDGCLSEMLGQRL